MTTYTPAAGVLACRVGDEVVLLDSSSGTYFRLAGVAGWIWDQVLERDDLSGLPDDLVDLCGSGAPDAEEVRGDIAELLSDLVARGLLRQAAAVS